MEISTNKAKCILRGSTHDFHYSHGMFCYLYACWFINRNKSIRDSPPESVWLPPASLSNQVLPLPRHICLCYLSLGLLISWEQHSSVNGGKTPAGANRQHNSADAATDWQRDTSLCKITCDVWAVCRNMLFSLLIQIGRGGKYLDSLLIKKQHHTVKILQIKVLLWKVSDHYVIMSVFYAHMWCF